MRPLLLHPSVSFDFDQPLPVNADALRQDLALDRVLEAMARGDPLLLQVATRVVLASVDQPDVIAYRQRVLRDCLQHRSVVRQLYDLAAGAIEEERRIFRNMFGQLPDAVLYRSRQRLELFIKTLRRLRALSTDHQAEFESDGFLRFFRMLEEQLGEDYLVELEEHLRKLALRDGVLLSARLGVSNRGHGYVLRRPRPTGDGWRARLGNGRRSAYAFSVNPNDETGVRALTEMQGRGIALVANAFAEATEHILAFLVALRAELGFYLGCSQLHDAVRERGAPSCFPEVLPCQTLALSAANLRDVSLLLAAEGEVVGNDLTADGATLIMITGANQGGKSTFLRSVGLAQLMLQSGMFVVAESFRGSVASGLFTHFKREEDQALESGKLDEELRRMSGIVEQLKPGAIVLCNESFTSTNEREGSEIGRQVVHGLVESGIRVLFVNHLFDLADSLRREAREGALFLRAERAPDGSRTYRVREGDPLPTSFGQDLYQRIFG